jgi:hypothetical protein
MPKISLSNLPSPPPDYLGDLARDLADRIAESHRKTFDRIFKAWADNCSAREAAAERLGKMGWTIPVWGALDLVDLAAQHSPEEVDEGFVTAYRQRRGARFRELGTDLMHTQSLQQWRPLIDECIWAHRRGRFLIVVPSLLSVTEGAVAQLTGTLKKGSSPRTVADRQASQLPPGSDRLLWVSLRAFLEGIFAAHDFRSTPPPALNRHWLLHGPAAAEWGEPDSVRLFQGLHTLTLLDR